MRARLLERPMDDSKLGDVCLAGSGVLVLSGLGVVVNL